MTICTTLSSYHPSVLTTYSVDDDQLELLAEKLRTPINAYGTTLKQYLVQTLVPAAKHVKATHASIETKVDVPFKNGFLEFNDASKNMENMGIMEQDELQDAYAESQVLPNGVRLWFVFPNGTRNRAISRNYSGSWSKLAFGAIKS